MARDDAAGGSHCADDVCSIALWTRRLGGVRRRVCRRVRVRARHASLWREAIRTQAATEDDVGVGGPRIQECFCGVVCGTEVEVGAPWTVVE
eukprot:scaffold141_cov123-Isochrysis_galbana.AAC.10